MTPQPKDPITVYVTSDFLGDVKKIEGTYLRHGTMSYAQYAAAPFVELVRRGKRKGVRYMKADYSPFMLILSGWGHPEPASGMVESEHQSPFMHCTESRYTSFDERYITDFNALINPYLDAHPESVVADYRHNKNTTPEEVEA